MLIWLGKTLFGWRYASFDFGFEQTIRRVRTARDGSLYCRAYGFTIREGTKGWFEL